MTIEIKGSLFTNFSPKYHCLRRDYASDHIPESIRDFWISWHFHYLVSRSELGKLRSILLNNRKSTPIALINRSRRARQKHVIQNFAVAQDLGIPQIGAMDLHPFRKG